MKQVPLFKNEEEVMKAAEDVLKSLADRMIHHKVSFNRAYSKI